MNIIRILSPSGFECPTMKSIGKMIGSCFVLVCALTVSGCGDGTGEDEESETRRTATYRITMVDQDLSYTRAGSEVFKHHVETATDGDMTVTLLPWGAVGTDREVIDQLRLGELEVVNATTPGLTGVIPEVQAYNLPFLFPDRITAWTLMLDPAHVAFIREHWLERSGNTLRFLGAAENAIRHMYTTRGPIRTPADLTEHRIVMRTMEAPLYVSLFEALGVRSVLTIPAAERYTALQTGMIDGTEGGLASAWEAGLLEVSEYVSLTGHMFDYHWYVVNNDFYKSLPERYREIVGEAALLAVFTQNVAAMRESDQALTEMRKAGRQVYQPTADELSQWREIGREHGLAYMSRELSTEYLDTVMEAVEAAHERIEAYHGRHATPSNDSARELDE